MKHLCLLWLLSASLAGPLHARTGAAYVAPDCDTLLTQDGRLLLVHVKEVTETQVIYTKCGAANNGLEYAMPQSAVKEIRLSERSARKGVYQAWIYTSGLSKPLKKYVLSTTDSSLLLVGSPLSIFEPTTAIQEILILDIKKIQFRKKGRVGRSMLAGFGIGAGMGLLAGALGGDDPGDFLSLTAGQKAVIGGVLLGFAGAVAGLISGFLKKSIPIDGSPDKYKRSRTLIQRYSLKKR